jgi:hypothetical protein
MLARATVEGVGSFPIDSPETVCPSKPLPCFGVEASNRNKKPVEGRRRGVEGTRIRRGD